MIGPGIPTGVGACARTLPVDAPNHPLAIHASATAAVVSVERACNRFKLTFDVIDYLIEERSGS
jgi:hypothetical protein